VEQLRKKGTPRFFPELSNQTKAGKYSDKVSKWFTRYRRENGVEGTSSEERKVFHSFRNTFISRCYDMNLPEDKIKDVVGHSHESVTAGIYRARPSVQILYRDIISKVRYDIDLSHLKKSSFVVSD
jgi:integrase